MKVLHVLYSKIYTGAEKVAAQIIKAFEGRWTWPIAAWNAKRSGRS